MRLYPPQLEELRCFLSDGDTVAVHSMDRLARTLDDLRSLVQRLTTKGVRIEFLNEHPVFTGENSPLANLMLSVMGALAEFERALIGNASARGLPWPRAAEPTGAQEGPPAREGGRAAAAGAGEQTTGLARESGISHVTLYRYLKTDSRKAAGDVFGSHSCARGSGHSFHGR